MLCLQNYCVKIILWNNNGQVESSVCQTNGGDLATYLVWLLGSEMISRAIVIFPSTQVGGYWQEEYWLA